MDKEKTHTSHDMDMAEALFTRHERTTIGWEDRADIASALALVRREDRNMACHICNKATELCCSDCRIDLGARVYVCSDTSCRDRHDAVCPGMKTAIQVK